MRKSTSRRITRLGVGGMQNLSASREGHLDDHMAKRVRDVILRRKNEVHGERLIRDARGYGTAEHRGGSLNQGEAETAMDARVSSRPVTTPEAVKYVRRILFAE